MYFFGDTYFQGFILKSVFQIAFMAVIITELVILIFTTWNNHKNSEKKTMSDRGSMLFIMIGFWLAIIKFIIRISASVTSWMLSVTNCLYVKKDINVSLPLGINHANVFPPFLIFSVSGFLQ